jgi:hypothetical protein
MRSPSTFTKRRRQILIKAWYRPATEDLVEQLIPILSDRASEGEVAEQVTKVVEALRGLGYEITIEVEIHGDMAKAFEWINDGAPGGDVRARPKRKE